MSVATLSTVRPPYGSTWTATARPWSCASGEHPRQPLILDRATPPPRDDHGRDAGGGDLPHLRGQHERIGRGVRASGGVDSRRRSAVAASCRPAASARRRRRARRFRTRGSRRSPSRPRPTARWPRPARREPARRPSPPGRPQPPGRRAESAPTRDSTPRVGWFLPLSEGFARFERAIALPRMRRRIGGAQIRTAGFTGPQRGLVISASLGASEIPSSNLAPRLRNPRQALSRL